eukprot:gnl/MRDRNA2_/MRDRNA2_86056_c0_seq1.p1 gnl/MRDRNA2_/MRDRNA2_86056_c0~~gnl/MRDRNA2_/MRDRNA2_86056_c0_seq1.p1  ORF type:complete len:204 (+),score=3.31 gnl/MRDRNA2_/MRDRNA2_86056_c0_seq1:446-1057(+)
MSTGFANGFPGHSTSPDSFLATLLEGTDGLTEVPLSRWDLEAYYDPEPGHVGTMYTKHGAFIDGSDLFDHSCFRISHLEAQVMDPQQRLMLQVGYQALLRGGNTRASLVNCSIGVFVGQMNYDWFEADQHMEINCITGFGGLAVSPAISANRISFVLGLTGPSVTVDSACSASLVSVDLALTQITQGRCDTAIGAGVGLILFP